MAAFHGKKGSATFTNLTFEITSFTVDAVAGVADSTVMDVNAVTSATHWRDYVAGFKDWTATCECLEPAAGGGLAALGTEAALGLDATDGLDYAGSAICTGFGVTIGDDAGRLTLSFQGTGTLSAS